MDWNRIISIRIRRWRWRWRRRWRRWWRRWWRRRWRFAFITISTSCTTIISTTFARWLIARTTRMYNGYTGWNSGTFCWTTGSVIGTHPSSIFLRALTPCTRRCYWTTMAKKLEENNDSNGYNNSSNHPRIAYYYKSFHFVNFSSSLLFCTWLSLSWLIQEKIFVLYLA